MVAFLRTQCVTLKDFISILKDVLLLKNSNETLWRIGKFTEKPQKMTNQGQASTKPLRYSSQGFKDVDPFSKQK